MSVGLPTGGTAPSNYWTERGPDQSLRQFGLEEGGSVSSRTIWNVRAADVTLLFMTHSSAGTDLTARAARSLRKPILIVDPRASTAVDEVVAFLTHHRPAIVNIAGHRESGAPGIHDAVYNLLVQALRLALAAP